MLAACTGRDVPPRASNGFVERDLRQFRRQLRIEARRRCRIARRRSWRRCWRTRGLEPSKRLDVLDAGCGTGLCGPLVAPYARRLAGVDLSEGMLAHAKEKNVYDELIEGRADGVPARHSARPST